MGARAARWRTGAAVALAAALLAIPSVQAATTRVLTITGGSAHPAHAFQTFDSDPPRLFDINGDGRPEIIAANDNQYWYVFDDQTGAMLSELTTTFPAGWGARTFNGPEAYRDGGVTHVVIQNSAAEVTSFRYDPAASTATHFAFVKEWERRLTDCFSNPGSDSKPVLVDLDKDGHYEVLASTEEVGVYALRGDTGAVYWKACIGGGNAEAESGDLNLDGWPDVVFGSDGGIVTALNGRTGGTMWTYNVLAHFNVSSGSMPVGSAIGQLDGLTGPDIVVGVRDSHDATNWTNDHALLLALSSGGSLLWGRQDPHGAPLTYTHPIIADADRDGQAEVYWADWNTQGHKPPWDESQAWQVVGPPCDGKPSGCANFYRYDSKGNLVWRQAISTFWQNKDIALADVDGDGQQEVLAVGPNSAGHEGIWSLDHTTGARKAFVDAYPWMVSRGPVLDDLHHDGKMGFVIEVGPQATSEGAAIQAYDTGVPFNAMWAHEPEYPLGPASTSSSTTTGTTTTTTSPPPGGCFAATFTIHSPNEWWEQVTVQASGHSIASAQVRVNGGAWTAMTHQSYGDWTASVHAVAGSKVEFQVRDSANGQSTSQPFTWLDGTTAKGSVACGTSSSSTTTTTTSPPPVSCFAATFTIKAPNEWWEELYPSASGHSITAASVRVNGGAWQPMSLSSWGAWTLSTHAVAGSKVEFQVRDSANAQSTSQPFTWMDGTLTKGSVACPAAPTTAAASSSSLLPTGTVSETAPAGTQSASDTASDTGTATGSGSDTASASATTTASPDTGSATGGP